MDELNKSRSDITSIKTGRERALPAMVRFYRRFDDAVKPLVEATACKAGCSYCCHYHVYISAPEAFALAQYVEILSASDRSAVTARLESNNVLIRGMTVDEHIATNVRCAFLSDAGSCLAYSVRPTACRRHHAVDVTPCKVTFDDPSSTMQNGQIAELLKIAGNFIGAHLHAQALLGADFTRYEMNGALHEAITNKSGQKRWSDGKNAFPSVRDRDLRSALG